MTMTTAEADKILADNFAAWVLELGLTVEGLDDRRAVLRLPWSDRLAREGGAMSGQALMAAGGTPPRVAGGGGGGGPGGGGGRRRGRGGGGG
ncbi:hypothetical protein ACFVOK_37855, partial [Streptomyces sp. NPDC057798]